MPGQSDSSGLKKSLRGLHARFVSLVRAVTPEQIRRSYTRKLAVGFVVIILMGVAIGGVVTMQTGAMVEDQTNDRLRDAATTEAESLGQWVERMKEETRLLSRTRLLRGHHDDPTRINHFLAHEVEQGRLPDEIQALHMIDASTQNILASAHEDDVNTQLRHSGLELGELDFEGPDDTIVTEPFRHNETGNATIAVVSPIPPEDAEPGTDTHDHDHNATATDESSGHGHQLVMLIDLNRHVGSISQPSNGFTRIVNDEGTVVMSHMQDMMLTSHANNSPDKLRDAIQRGLDGETGTSKMDMQMGDMDERTFLVGYAPVPVEGTNWVVVPHVPASEAFALRDTISMNIIALILLGLVGFSIVWGVIHLDMTRLERLSGKAEELRDGNLDVEVPELKREDEIGGLYGTFESMRVALKNQVEEAESAREEAEASRARALEMSNHLEQKAEEYSAVMQECASGDLTQRMDKDGENEAMDQIASEFNDMIEELEKTTGQLKSYVDEVEEAGAEVEQSADTVREASEQVANSIQTIAFDAENQKERLQTVSEKMDEIAGDLENLSNGDSSPDVDTNLDNTKEIANEISEITKLSEDTQSETDTVSAAAEEQAAELNEVSQRANDLQRYAQPLRDILNRFDTEAEHEFVFSVGPTGGDTLSSANEDDD